MERIKFIDCEHKDVSHVRLQAPPNKLLVHKNLPVDHIWKELTPFLSLTP
jgi:hypothetical protein